MSEQSNNNIESLIVRYLNETINDEEYLALTSWIKQSEENELAFNQIREIIMVSRTDDKDFQFDTQAALERIREKMKNEKKPIPRFRHTKPERVIKLSYRWAAAVMLFVFLAGMLFYHWIYPQINAPASVAYQEIIVPLGSRTKLILPDGSRVSLNAGTTLRYAASFGNENRDLWLNGEGYFDVYKSALPFVVHSGSVRIKAVGTSFNVRAYASENNIETTLVEGKIIVTHNENTQDGREEITLLPNQKLIIAKDGISGIGAILDNIETQNDLSDNSKVIRSEGMVLQEKIDPVPDVSWKDNVWVINRESIEDLAVKLERRFDVKIVFKDEQLKEYRYNGSLPDLSLEQVLNAMSMVSPVKYSVQGKTVFFYESKNYTTIK